ncbi:MAG: Crotonyl-CoA reductase [Planctomycetota bacterium]
MKAVILHGLGGTDQLKYEDTQEPQPGPHQVRIALEAAALNHRDIWIRRGLYAGIKLPVILGSDGVGHVDAVGDKVDPSLLSRRFWINPSLSWGENPHAPDYQAWRILGLPDNGTYAEKIVVDADQIEPCPANWSAEEAAALPLAGLTAYRALFSRGQLKAGQTVIITGIGGGVSQMAMQMAIAAGAKVIVSSSCDTKIENARREGAIGGVNYRDDLWVQKARELSGGEGPDLAIDSAGGATIDALIDLVRPGGTIVNYGQTTGACPNLEVRRLFWKQVNLLGTTMGNTTEFRAMLNFYDEHRLRPIVDSVYSLSEAAAAHERMESADQTGKIILRIHH